MGSSAAATQRLCCKPAGPTCPQPVVAELSPTFAVWSREAVAARARGPPKPQHRSVMGRLCRDQTCRGSGIWEGSACSTLWGEQRWAGTGGRAGQGSASSRLPLLAARSTQDTEGEQRMKARGELPIPRGGRELSCQQQGKGTMQPVSRREKRSQPYGTAWAARVRPQGKPLWPAAGKGCPRRVQAQHLSRL